MSARGVEGAVAFQLRVVAELESPTTPGGAATTPSGAESINCSSVTASSDTATSLTCAGEDDTPPLVRVKRRARGTSALSRERLWSTFLSACVASIPGMLVGYTLGFASSALLDLTGDGAADVPETYLFTRLISDLFQVSLNAADIEFRFPDD